ncbi:MAG: insulinase family protein [Bacteroidaceae bacterium]|nr:insulinase family protein [Bacteroidaceae bacterium]
MMRMMKRLFTALILLGSVLVASAQQQPQMPPIPTDPNVRIGKLENGLTYYIRHNELPENRADFYIAQKVGSILEEENQRGLAHFLEHMCFNGTTHFPGKGIINYLETIGVRFGENLNAYTSIDETVYNIENVPVIRDGIVDSCLLILHDWANDLTLDPKEIDNERGVIHEEWRTGQGAMMRMYDQVLPKIFAGSKYGHRLPIGTIEVIDNFPYQALRDYYETWYRPDQQGIIVVGDIDVDKVEAKIKEMFSDIEMPANAPKRVYEQVPDNKEPIVAIAKDKEQANTVIYLMHKHPATPNEIKNNMGYLVQNYMFSMIANMLNARLEELRQSAEPPFIYGAAGDSDFILAKTIKAFFGIASSKDDGIPTALGTLVREIERVRKFGFTTSEYSRAKADYLRQLESAYNEREKIKNDAYVSECLNHFINNEPILGIENEYAIMNQIVPNIPVEAINSILPQLINDENTVIMVLGPDKEGMVYPTEEEILNVLKQTKAEDITAYVDKVSDEPLMKEAPKAGKIIKTEEGAFGSTALTLSNGVRVVIKNTDFKADEIRMRALSPGGTSVFGTKEALQLRMLNSVAGLGGLGNFSNVDLEKVLAGKKASISASVSGLSEGLNGSCSPKDLETLLQLVYLSFTAPRMDDAAFESYKARTKAALANQEANPSTALSDTLQMEMYGNHPMATRIKADMIDQIDYNRIMEMYKDRFKEAGDFTFLFVGNINLEEAKPLIETYLGGLPTINRKENYQDIKLNIRKGVHKNVFEKQLETPKATVLSIISGDCEYNLKNSLLMTMLKQTMDMVYTETIREKEGASYGVSVAGQLTRGIKDEALFQIYFDTDPAKREKMEQIVMTELQTVVKEGPRPEHLAKVKEFLLKKHLENAKENGYWLGRLVNYYWNNTDMDTNYEKLVNELTVEDVKNFAKALIDQGNIIEVTMTAKEAK